MNNSNRNEIKGIKKNREEINTEERVRERARIAIKTPLIVSK